MKTFRNERRYQSRPAQYAAFGTRYKSRVLSRPPRECRSTQAKGYWLQQTPRCMLGVWHAQTSTLMTKLALR
jgi:hypothetical protein